MNIKNSMGLGYAFGVFIVIPAFSWLVNTFWLSGNRASDVQIQRYIDNSIHLVLKMPSKYDKGIDQIVRESNGYIRSLSNNGYNIMKGYIFYEHTYKKYFKLITFNGFDIRARYNKDGSLNYKTDVNPDRYNYLDGFYLNGTVNKIQWKNPNYGSKENPYPLFARDVPSQGGHSMRQIKEGFDVSESLNFKFVREYLDHFVSKKEFNSLNLGER